MAQLPWSVEERRAVTFPKARLAANKCAQELSQLLPNGTLKTRVVSLLEAFVESLEECEANDFITENAKHVPCVSLVKASGVVQIHPSFMGDALKGAYSYIAGQLMQYNEDLEGIWLSFAKVRQVDNVGYLTDGDSYGIMSVRISLRMLVYTPTVANMFGKVTKAHQQRLSLLVYGIFGVAVRSSEQENEQAREVKEGQLVDVHVNDVKILQKNKWVMLSTTMDNVKVIS